MLYKIDNIYKIEFHIFKILNNFNLLVFEMTKYSLAILEIAL